MWKIKCVLKPDLSGLTLVVYSYLDHTQFSQTLRGRCRDIGLEHGCDLRRRDVVDAVGEIVLIGVTVMTPAEPLPWLIYPTDQL